MPLLARGAFTLSSPVLGLNRYCAFDVNSVEAVPVVADANKGKTFVDVLVSLLSAAPPTEAQAAPL